MTDYTAQLTEMIGPSIEPASGGPAKQLVVFLHGLGSDGNDLIDLGTMFARHLPDAAFLSPNAPFPFDMAPYGRQWFSLQTVSNVSALSGVKAVAPILNAFLDQELDKRGLTNADLALIGFSQGTMMSLHVAPRRDTPVAAVVGYSGRLIAPELLGKELKSRPPVLLVHGEADPVVPFVSMRLSEEALAGEGIDVKAVARPGLQHGIDAVGLEEGIAFVARAFKK
ncbi:MAG TPA: dienelactone hydrolase family protein [Magnetospirillaceae bacterium]|jgi:phospholipase/carboxylesterase